MESPRYGSVRKAFANSIAPSQSSTIDFSERRELSINRPVADVSRQCPRHQTLGRHSSLTACAAPAWPLMLHGLGDGELHEHLAAERQHHDEERKLATGIAHRDGSVAPQLDLRALAGSEVQLEIDRPPGRPDAADVLPQDCDAAAVSLLAQTLEDLLSAIRVGVRVMPGVKGSRTLPRGRLRRGSKRERAAHTATCGFRPAFTACVDLSQDSLHKGACSPASRKSRSLPTRPTTTALALPGGVHGSRPTGTSRSPVGRP